MTTSGTTAFTMDLGEIITEAYERCGVMVLSGYDYRTARRSIDLMMHEWSNRGLNLWTVEEASQVLTSGTATYTLAADTVDIIEAVMRTGTGTNQQDQQLNRMSVVTYSQLTNKLYQSRPLQYYVSRTSTPTVTMWPVPDSAMTYTLQYWRLRRIQDTGTPASNTMDLPFRFLPALVAGLAYYLSMKKPQALERAIALKGVYDEQWKLAADEDRSRASIRFVPWVGP